MSAKRHVLVPRCFVFAGEVSRDSLVGFRHMTGSEASALELAGRIESVGPKLWRLTTETFATARSSETGDGLLSCEIDRSLQEVLRLEMAARRSSR